jgi:hypothetical protein
MVASDWLHKAAQILDNQAQLTAKQVQKQFLSLLGVMTRWQSKLGTLQSSIIHLLKVTRSYWSGLFHCYQVEGLPRTNNDLEHLFGKWRHHQRRCTGRKVAPQSFVLRGSVQLVAAVATQLKIFSAAELATVPVESWQQVRSQLQQHQRKRLEQRSFRRSPAAYLSQLETQLFQLTLPL